MKKTISFIIITFVMVSIGTYSYAQNSIVMSSVKKDNSSSNWYQFTKIGSVVFYYQYHDCGPIGYILLKIENNSNCNVNVTWNYELVNKGVNLPISLDDSQVSLNINSKQSLQGECGSVKNRNLAVFVAEPNITRLTIINLLDIKVSLNKITL